MPLDAAKEVFEMEKTRLNKEFFKNIAYHLLLEPIEDYAQPLSLDGIGKPEFYKQCLAKWATVIELAEKNPQSYFKGFYYEYIDYELEYDRGKLKPYYGCSEMKLVSLMVCYFHDFDLSERGFNGLKWDLSPCPKEVLEEPNPARSLLLGQGFIEPLPEQGYYCPKYKEHWNDGVRKLLTENGIRSSLRSMADPETGFIRNRDGNPYCKGNLYATTSKW